jgi:nucleoside-diphosphate-sugar epimerase
MTPLVALTGATGFIGRNLKQTLQRRGTPLRLLTRQTKALADPQEGVEWVQGDLEDAASLRELVEGASAVIHCAGAVRGASKGSFLTINARGTTLLAEAAAELDPQPRFLLISSLAAREPQLSWYAESKAEGERGLRERAGTMPWAVFRPTAVYGPGDKEMQPLFKTMRRGFLPVLGPSNARVTLLHVEDLVRAVLLWLDHPEPVTGTYELHDGHDEGYDWRDVAAVASRIWKRPVGTVLVPRGVLTSLAALNLFLARLTGSEPMLTPGKVRELRHPDWRCDNGPLTEVLGWEPEIDLAKALRAL